MVGRQEGTGYWWGPQYPNSTEKLLPNAPGCFPACLFNIREDPTEHVDLRLAMPAKYAMVATILSAHARDQILAIRRR